VKETASWCFFFWTQCTSADYWPGCRGHESFQTSRHNSLF